MLGSHTEWAQLEEFPFQGKKSEFGGIVNYEAGLPEW